MLLFPLQSLCYHLTSLFPCVDVALAIGCNWEQVGGKEQVDLLHLYAVTGASGGR